MSYLLDMTSCLTSIFFYLSKRWPGYYWIWPICYWGQLGKDFESSSAKNFLVWNPHSIRRPSFPSLLAAQPVAVRYCRPTVAVVFPAVSWQRRHTAWVVTNCDFQLKTTFCFLFFFAGFQMFWEWNFIIFSTLASASSGIVTQLQWLNWLWPY